MNVERSHGTFAAGSLASARLERVGTTHLVRLSVRVPVHEWNLVKNLGKEADFRALAAGLTTSWTDAESLVECWKAGGRESFRQLAKKYHSCARAAERAGWLRFEWTEVTMAFTAEQWIGAQLLVDLLGDSCGGLDSWIGATLLSFTDALRDRLRMLAAQYLSAPVASPSSTGSAFSRYEHALKAEAQETGECTSGRPRRQSGGSAQELLGRKGGRR